MLTEIIQLIQIITNSSQNTKINNLYRKFRLYVYVCVFGGGGYCVCVSERVIHIILQVT